MFRPKIPRTAWKKYEEEKKGADGGGAWKWRPSVRPRGLHPNCLIIGRKRRRASGRRTGRTTRRRRCGVAAAAAAPCSASAGRTATPRPTPAPTIPTPNNSGATGTKVWLRRRPWSDRPPTGPRPPPWRPSKWRRCGPLWSIASVSHLADNLKFSSFVEWTGRNWGPRTLAVSFISFDMSTRDFEWACERSVAATRRWPNNYPKISQ